MMVCLETTFIVDMLRGDPAAARKIEEFRSAGETITVASPTIVEILGNAYRNKNLRERREMEAFCKEVTVLPLDVESAVIAAKIDAGLIEAGNIIGFADILISAIAQQHGEALVTRNEQHFRRIPGLEVVGY